MSKILFFYQNTFSQTGGIQTFNKRFINALEDISNVKSQIEASIVGIYDKEEDVKTTLSFDVLNDSKIKAILYTIFNAKKYNVIIFAHVNLAPLASLVHIINPSARIIFCTHGIEIWKKLSSMTEWIMNKSTILTVSNFSKDELYKFNPKLKDVRIFPNCIKVKDYLESKPNPYNSQVFNILSITRLDRTEHLKGIDTVIKALSLIKGKIDMHYTVIGKGDDIPRLKALAKDLQVTDLISFLGFVDEIDAFYEHCDVFILPSKKEGFGIVYLEAMQYSKPVIACNFGGPTDVIEDKKTGVLCEYDDHVCVAESLIKFSSNANFSQILGAKGYDRLIKNFTYEKFKKRLANILEDIL